MRKQENNLPYYNFDKEYVHDCIYSYISSKKYSSKGKKIKPTPDKNEPKDYEYGGFWYAKGRRTQKKLISFYTKYGFTEDQNIYLKWCVFSDYPFPSMIKHM